MCQPYQPSVVIVMLEYLGHLRERARPPRPGARHTLCNTSRKRIFLPCREATPMLIAHRIPQRKGLGKTLIAWQYSRAAGCRFRLSVDSLSA
jgi:hypothetical protein